MWLRCMTSDALATGGAYLVMQLIAGKSWREHLRGGSVSLNQVSSWMQQLCSAVAAAHSIGVIHRDLKPENIMIADADSIGRVIVLDFGLAKLRSALSDADHDLTLPGVVMGTRGYMSPEQRAGRNVDLRTDVFAVGVICAEAVSGRRPPRNGASKKWLRACLKPCGLNGSPLGECLERCLAEEPARRPDIAEFREEVSTALAEASLRRRPCRCPPTISIRSRCAAARAASGDCAIPAFVSVRGLPAGRSTAPGPDTRT